MSVALVCGFSPLLALPRFSKEAGCWGAGSSSIPCSAASSGLTCAPVTSQQHPLLVWKHGQVSDPVPLWVSPGLGGWVGMDVQHYTVKVRPWKEVAPAGRCHVV